MIKVRFSASRPAGAHCLILPVAKSGLDGASLPGDASVLRAAAKAARFEGEAGSSFEQHIGHEAGAQRLVLLGTGAGSAEDLEKAGGALSAKLLTSGETEATLDVSGLSASAEAVARMAAAAALRSWRYDTYRTKLPEAQKPTLRDLVIVGAPEGMDAAWAHYSALVQGVALTRELVTEPANVIYPETFVERCQRLKDAGVEIEVLGEAEMRAAGMGALLGVAQGSVREPKLLVMRWDGTNGAQQKPVVFVGKGVTFDTGGVSLKPGPGMQDMKGDMGGSAAVVGAMMALAKRKAKANVVGLVGLVENMPDGNAQRPGDIVRAAAGKTIEIQNTDAEGRLVLCDVLWYAQKKFHPRAMIDLATLTGAIIISLGNEHAGLFSNNDELAAKITAAGKEEGEPVWRLPLGPGYDKQLDSEFADMRNIGNAGNAGSITAAQFLQRFVDEGRAWAHLDIAGTAWKPGNDNPLEPTWATGWGVRILDRLIADNYED